MFHYLQAKGRVLIVGDLHGCYTELQQCLADRQFDPAQGDCLVSLGDLIDRGRESLPCLRLLKEPWFHAVRGNHENLMLLALLGNSKQNKWLWFSNGGDWFTDLSETEQQEVVTLCHEKVRRLPYAMEVATRGGAQIGIVHADPVFNHWPDLLDHLRAPAPEPPVLDKLLWQRERLSALRQQQRLSEPFRQARISGIDLVCVGHTPLPGMTPWAAGNLLWLDNGAFAGHGLTLIDADEWVSTHAIEI